MIVAGGLRLPADLTDIPANTAVEALHAGKPLTADELIQVIDTRSKSVEYLATANRWFTLGRAYLRAGDPDKARKAYAAGLMLAPARGSGWAGYFVALASSGDRASAAAAHRYSILRAPYDPAALRLRQR